MIRELERKPVNGIPLLFVIPALMLATILAFIFAVSESRVVISLLLGFLMLVEVVSCFGFFMVAPNESRVLQLFGKYSGTAKTSGLRWANPFYTKQKVSVRVRNFETTKLKVNDNHGNPIEIAAVVVWRVIDTAEAIFEVDDYQNYVHVQSESAVRNLATGFPYDAHAVNEVSLTGNTADISEKLKGEIQERLFQAGVEVIEARISHLAYAPEIAAAMLQRQQASAVVAARQKIVEGAVGMVETALDMLSEKHIIELDDERRAAMVSNLLVVLCSGSHTQPVVNTGSLYN